MMNKKSWIIAAAIAVSVVGAGSVYAATANEAYIGKDKAKALALKIVPGTVTDTDFERERGTATYEVEIVAKDSLREADVIVDATSGKVLYIDYDDDNERSGGAVAAVSPDATSSASPNHAMGAPNSPEPSAMPSVSPSPSAGPGPSAMPSVSPSPSAGPGSSAMPSVAPSPSASPDSHATPGASPSPNPNSAQSAANEITRERAGQLALAQVPGKLVEIERDNDDGRRYYEVKIRTRNGIVEVDVAAIGGTIVSVDDQDDRDDRDDHDDDRDDDHRDDNDDDGDDD